MENDKLFSLYAFTLLAGVASVATASIMSGFASLPSLGVFVEHLAMSLTVRGAYHSFGGPYPLLSGWSRSEAAVAPAPGASPSAEEKLAA